MTSTGRRLAMALLAGTLGAGALAAQTAPPPVRRRVVVTVVGESGQPRDRSVVTVRSRKGPRVEERVTLDALGQARFELPPGEYSVEAADYEYKDHPRQRLHLAADGPAEVALRLQLHKSVYHGPCCRVD